MVRVWRDAMLESADAIEAHTTMFRLVVHVDLRLARARRALTAEQARGARAGFSHPAAPPDAGGARPGPPPIGRSRM